MPSGSRGDDGPRIACSRCLCSLGQIAVWRKSGEADRRAAALHIDTGMARLGLPRDELAELAADRSRLRGVELALVLSHLACGDDPEHPLNGASSRISGRPWRPSISPAGRASLAASSGIFLGPDFHFDLVRPGAALYGLAPLADAPQSDAPSRST